MALELKVMCMDNLLAAPGVRVYFKDLESRFLLVSAGCDATVPTDRNFRISLARRTSTFTVKSTLRPRFATSKKSFALASP